MTNRVGDMITTVTISTVTTVTTAVSGVAATISAILIVALIVFLATKELASASNSEVALRVSRYLGIVIIPMLAAFAVIMVVKVVEILA